MFILCRILYSTIHTYILHYKLLMKKIYVQFESKFANSGGQKYNFSSEKPEKCSNNIFYYCV